MPELPEVETTVRDLRKKLVGLKITGFWSDRSKPIKQSGGISQFTREVKNKNILSVNRRAKYIVMDLEGDKALFVHQKISGHLLYGVWNMEHGIWRAAKPGPLRDVRENQYIRYMFFLSNGHQLAMSDLRRFSKVVLVKDKDVSNLPEIKKLGPEPLETSFKKFSNLFSNKRGKIKQVLMAPFFIAGIGNIYADEILWDSGFHPLSRVENFSDKDLKKIFGSMVKILKKAVKLGGSSVDDYRMPSGKKGKYQNQTKAYQHQGEKCSKNDGGIIKRIKLGGRSAHFCPVHQKLK